jgi:hypothetical protein
MHYIPILPGTNKVIPTHKGAKGGSPVIFSEKLE